MRLADSVTRPATEAGDGDLHYFSVFEFQQGGGRALSEATCVVAGNENHRLGSYLASTSGFSRTSGANRSYEMIACEYDMASDYIDCPGTRCYASGSPNLRKTSRANFYGSPSGWYDCRDGCWVDGDNAVMYCDNNGDGDPFNDGGGGDPNDPAVAPPGVSIAVSSGEGWQVDEPVEFTASVTGGAGYTAVGWTWTGPNGAPCTAGLQCEIPVDASGTGAYSVTWHGTTYAGTASVSVEPPGEFGFTPCVPEFDPLCHLKKIWKKEHDYIYNDMAAVRALGGNCVTLANKMQEFFEANPPRLLFFDGPRPNLTGETSLADNHGDAIHISRQGKDPNTGEITINSNSDKARLFRHEAKHSLGWSHELMQSIGYQCDPPEGP